MRMQGRDWRSITVLRNMDCGQGKIKHRKVEIIEYERKVIKNNWYIRYK